MTPSELRETLATLRLSQNTLSQLIGVTNRSVSAWTNGKQGVPRHVVAYLRLFGMITFDQQTEEIRRLGCKPNHHA